MSMVWRFALFVRLACTAQQTGKLFKSIVCSPFARILRTTCWLLITNMAPSKAFNLGPARKVAMLPRDQYADDSETSGGLNQNTLAAIIISAVLVLLLLAYLIWRKCWNRLKKRSQNQQDGLLIKGTANREEYGRTEMDGEGVRRGVEIDGRPIEFRTVTNRMLELDGGEAGTEMDAGGGSVGSVRNV
ncbi:hypothetical protein EJ04DRAFT_68694 [Polyplosphaeria fusca]|uniref:Uncharacterized protein n=1 Tax=Polyplosphaeria fusca TaxID=682080 RepID=A0A9P4R6W4_9PLEO|nr:hypothetical protein EJ04DRAFT_68694 [Polyplosphaeria fusca]